MITDSNIVFIEKVYSWFCRFLDPRISLFIACQSALETGFGSSSLALDQSNFFGMKTPRVRLTTNIGTGSFAVYTDFDNSCLDYLLWLSWNRFAPKHLDTVFNFKTKLRNCGYCPDLGYYDRIQTIYDKFAPLMFNNLID